MCGICGIVNSNNLIDVNQLLSMARSMRHRGPDDEGFVLSNSHDSTTSSFHHDETIDSIKSKTQYLQNCINANVGLGFRRLSILDLSENGHQPMVFDEAGIWIVFNGEIYNYIEIREELRTKGYSFKSNTDTEVILKSYHEWGEECVHKFNGMWAFTILDSTNKKLFCSRDRFGIKPFYFNYKTDSHFVFASEIKAVLQVIKSEPDKQALYDSFALGYSDHNDRTFFGQIKQLRGGHNLILKDGKLSIYPYYKIINQPSYDSFDDAKAKFKELLFDAVRIRLRSDVPLGYALSGGIDSSSIVGIASKINSGSNNTFSMIYPGDELDESFFIKKVIQMTGVEHHFVTPGSKDFLSDLDKFIWHQEEPFFGTSYYGEFKLRELIRKNDVTVSLEGQGADEIITGYTSLLIPYFFDLISNLRLKKIISEYNLFSNSVPKPSTLLKSYFLHHRKKDHLISQQKYPFINHGFFHDLKNNNRFFKGLNSGSHLNNSLYEMLIYTSIPQQLIRADKNSMAFSVECRFPFLDYRLVQYAINLPFEYKTKNGMTKYILREAMKELLPPEVFNRKDKIGFAIPKDRFYSDSFGKILLDRISAVDLSNFNFIDRSKFLSVYGKGNLEFDWKFWKTASVLLWYESFFL